MEQKTYWWRILVILFAGILFGYGYVSVNVDKLGWYSSFTDSIILFALSLFVTSMALLFVYDKVFLKWFYFSIFWWLCSLIIISMTPEYGGGLIIGYNPDRSTVAFGIGLLFVIVSLVKLVWDTRKPRQNTGQR